MREKKNVFHLPNGKRCYIENTLQTVGNSVVYNIEKDWDFVFVVTGNRMVRTGKSVLAMNFGAYIAHRIAQKLKIPYEFSEKNIFFDSQDMMTQAQQMRKHSVIVFDEARESMVATRAAQKIQQDILDFFAEAGQLNHVFILVMPDFFELRENMAVARSEGLINVYREKVKVEKDLFGHGERVKLTRFDRGQYAYYNRTAKRNLYDYAKVTRKKRYDITKPSGYGRFTNNYTIDEEKYREMKREALMRFDDKKKAANAQKTDVIRDKLIINLSQEGNSAPKVVEKLFEGYGYQISVRRVNQIKLKHKKESEELGLPEIS